jgi:hypothetical protein
MIRTRFVATALTVCAAAVSLLAASPALAKGGGGGNPGGGGTPPPSETPAATFCPEGTTEQGVTQPDGTVIFGVEANGAGCVVVQTAPHNGFALLATIDAPGWVSVFRGSGPNAGDLSRVEIDYEQFTTGRKVEVRIEPGRTEVK